PFENEPRESVPAHLREGLPRDHRPFHSFDVGKLVTDLKFENSLNERGLQLADILGNTFRRACSRRLQPAGWERLGELMIRDVRTHRGVDFVRLRSGRETTRLRDRPYWSVVSRIEEDARPWEVERT